VRILYRLRQFWRILTAQNRSPELEQARVLLTPAQMALFVQLQPGEKAHACYMVRKLIEQGESQPDLLVAALLHDVGKLHYRLNPLERAMVVVVGWLMPEQTREWGNLPPHGWEAVPHWRKAFIVAGQHAGWGAELARGVGVSPLTETLIRLHDDPHSPLAGDAEIILLQKLWLVDNEN
jgi:hypothetical protein